MRSRRSFLRGAVLVGAVGAAGCHENTGDDDPDGQPAGQSDDDTPGAESTPTEGPPDETTPTEGPPDETTPSADPTGAWPRFQFDLRNGGIAPRGGAAGDGVYEEWRADFDERVEVQPIFDEERVYVASRDAVYALDRVTGEELWRFGTDSEAPATPVVDGDYVYAVTSRGVYKIRATEGWSAWEREFVAEFPDLRSVMVKSPPVVLDDRVYVHLAIRRSSGSPSAVSRVVALEEFSGEPDWTFDGNWKIDGPPGPGPYTAAPAIADGRLYVTSGNRDREATVCAVDVGNGSRHWATDYVGYGHRSVTVHDGAIYFADQYLHSFDAAGGTRRVRRRADPRPNARGLVATGDRVVAAARTFGNDEGSLLGFDTDGRPEWQFPGGGHMYTPAGTTETVYAGNSDGNLYAVSVADGTPRWEHPLEDGDGGDARIAAPAVAADRLYVAASFGSRSGFVSSLAFE